MLDHHRVGRHGVGLVEPARQRPCRADHEHRNGWLDTAFTRSLLFSDPVATASALVEWLHTWLFVKTG
nr:DUF4400 domain-containing protein [Halomonas elongata]